MSITGPRTPGFAASLISPPARCRSLALRGFLRVARSSQRWADGHDPFGIASGQVSRFELRHSFDIRQSGFGFQPGPRLRRSNSEALKFVPSAWRPCLNPCVMHNPIIVALDVPKLEGALKLVEQL